MFFCGCVFVVGCTCVVCTCVVTICVIFQKRKGKTLSLPAMARLHPLPDPLPDPLRSTLPDPLPDTLPWQRVDLQQRCVSRRFGDMGWAGWLPYAAHVCGCCDVAHTHLPFACCFAVTVSQHAWSRHKLMGSHKLKRVGRIAATRSVLRALQSVAQEIARCCALWWLFRV